MSASLTAIRSLYERGYITKEAGIELLALRERVVTEKVAELTKRAAGPLGQFGKAMQSATADTSWPEMLARVIKIVGLGAGLAGGAAGVQGGIHAIQGHKSKKAIEHSRGIVLKNLSGPNVTPEVRRAHEIVFDTVAEYAPSVASNPAVAQGIVNGLATAQTLEKGMPKGLDANLIRQLAETQTRIDESAKARSPFHPFVETHGKFLSGPMSAKLIEPVV